MAGSETHARTPSTWSPRTPTSRNTFALRSPRQPLAPLKPHLRSRHSRPRFLSSPFPPPPSAFRLRPSSFLRTPRAQIRQDPIASAVARAQIRAPAPAARRPRSGADPHDRNLLPSELAKRPRARCRPVGRLPFRPNRTPSGNRRDLPHGIVPLSVVVMEAETHARAAPHRSLPRSTGRPRRFHTRIRIRRTSLWLRTYSTAIQLGSRRSVANRPPPSPFRPRFTPTHAPHHPETHRPSTHPARATPATF